MGLDRARKGQLWYAPAGDGGVLVFAPDDGGGDTALLFARNLAHGCKPEVEIRLGIATGSVVVIEGSLPAGKGILRADKLSSFPANWQICVNKAFWNGRSETDQRLWRTTPEEER